MISEKAAAARRADKIRAAQERYWANKAAQAEQEAEQEKTAAEAQESPTTGI